MPEAPLHLQAFEWSFEKPRIFVVGSIEDAVSVFSHIQHDLLFRGRRILVYGAQEENKKNQQKFKVYQQPWDLILKIRTNTDYSFLATYLQNIQKPSSVLWLGGQCPPALLQKFEGIYWICQTGGLPPSGSLWNTVFISYSLPSLSYKEWFLLQLPTQGISVLNSIEDLREKKAGIVVNLSERSVKWYDAGSLEGKEEDLSIHDIRDTLRGCTEQLSYFDT